MKPTQFINPQCKFFPRYIIALVVLVMLSASVSDTWATDLTRVQIAAEAQVDNDNILLGSIAKIEGPDAQEVLKLSGVVVGRAPLPGSSRTIDGGSIKTRLKQNGFDLANLVLDLPASITITRGFIEVSRKKIEGLVADHIAKNLVSENPNARIKGIQVSESMRLPVGRITYAVSAPRNRRLVGQVPLAVNFEVNGKAYKRVWATATIEVLAEVVVTKKPMGRHKPITEDDIEVLPMDLAKVPDNVITDPEAVLGKRTRRAIGSQTVLRANLVEMPPLVKRGDVVVIVAETKGLKITALGQVKKKGAMGDRIPVVNFESQKVLYARVMDANTVKVDF